MGLETCGQCGIPQYTCLHSDFLRPRTLPGSAEGADSRPPPNALSQQPPVGRGQSPAALFQGTGALAIFAVAVGSAFWLKRRPPRSTVLRLFVIWMTYHRFFESLPQVVVGAILPQNDVGMAMDSYASHGRPNPQPPSSRTAQPFRWKSRAANPRCRTWRGVAPIMRRNVRVKCAASENPAA